jgi:L-asparaginase II
MSLPSYVPLVETTRGSIVESIHYGAIAVSDARGNLIASVGDPEALVFLRSSSKPSRCCRWWKVAGWSALG